MSFSFNSAGIDTNNAFRDGFEPLPAGSYLSCIVESELKPTNNGAGKYLQLVWEVLDGPAKGRKFWQRLNVIHQSQQAQEIAQRQLAAICQAIGVVSFSNSVELHRKPALVRLTIKAGTEERGPDGQVRTDAEGNPVWKYKPSNEVVDVKPAGEGAPAAAGAPAAPAARAAGTRPAPTWAAKKAVA